MYLDPSGEWAIFAALASIGPLGWIAIALAVIVVAMVATNVLDPVVETLDNVNNDIIEAKNSIAVAIAISVASEIEKSNNGTYAIQFSDGKYYVGKGSPPRMYISATREGMLHNSFPTSFRFELAANDKEAFMKEYIWMVDYGYTSNKDTSQLYNRIWSPGRFYYFQENLSLYPGDYWGR